MEALKRYINYYINEYSNKFYEYKKNLDLLDEYKYDFDTFLSYNFTTYLKIFYVGTSKYAFDKYEELVDLYQEYFDLIEEYDYIGLKELLEKIDEIVKKDNLKDYIIKGFSYKEKFNNFNKLDFNSNLITFLSLTFNDDSGKMDFEAYNTFLKEFLNKKALSLFFAIVEIYKVKNVIKEMETIEGRKKDKQKVLESYTTRLNRIIDLIRGYRFKFEVEYKELEKEKKKYISILKDLERDLESGKPIDLEKYKKLIDNDKIITEIVLYNNRFQNAAYKEVKEEKEELNKTDLSKFESELLQNNINLDITKISIEIDLAKKKLSLLSKTKELIKYNNVLLYFINNISIETIKTIITMIVEKDITEEFVLENIFNLEEDKINNFINNIKLFKSYKISVCSIIKYNKNIMFNSNIKLKELIHIYLLYGIKLDNECYNFEWLEKDLSNIIDKFIEINQYDLIKNNLSLLNTSSNMIVKRCILYMYLNNSVVNEQNKLRGSLRKEDNFIMSDDELNETIITNYDNYIPKDIIEVLNANDFINNNVYDINLDSLNDYLINPYTYKFNNILISKNKIIRNLNILLNKELDKVYSIKELLLYSIIYNYPNLLLSNTIELIKDIINKKVKKLTK